ncbi:glycosyltransferase family 4 protein [Roseomonas gilardii subsp. gilardii]|uniref:glycosyltransferase family 4 protein n=1 Tax=Roseomonas gilardii TaxID=257708 RepID=UPI001FFB21A4|nr:glycosyltransferase family 1 protein [Roseomonas gilardii]UPG73127.1 glycosyltransferase family 4 protein [Roseomonas gilardii subsp. gilardii]
MSAPGTSSPAIMNSQAPDAEAPSTIWVEIGDLVQYFESGVRPSGIQRVTFEICRALHGADAGAGRVRFVRRSGPRQLDTVSWRQIESAFGRIIAPASTTAARPGVERAARDDGMGHGAEPDVRALLASGLRLQGAALRELLRLPAVAGAEALELTRRRLRRRHLAGKTASQLRFEEGVPLEQVARPGDSLLVLGSPWFINDYGQTVRWLRDDLRMRFALLIHDLIPIRRPEWCDRGVIISFIAWHRGVLPLADQIFANSRATAEDVTRWAQEIGLDLPRPVRPVPMGTGLGIAALPMASSGNAVAGAGAAASDLPEPGSYVLFVSTLEARKNHALLFRVWRRLLGEMPREQVPTLVFAGRVGWLVADLMQQLENAEWLGGKIRLVRDPSDEELLALYRDCRFTLYPSFYEGWGLPVSESLALGRPCIASDRTSLPEAGGALARYFDPDDLDDACATIRAVIEDPQGLEEWRERVAREFRHVPWSDSADAIRETMARLEAEEAEL